MKKIALLLVAVVMSATFASAQSVQAAESLLKAKERSDKDIQNPKKNVKYATWIKRGNLFLDMVQFTSKGLWKGMPQKGLMELKFLWVNLQKLWHLRIKRIGFTNVLP